MKNTALLCAALFTATAATATVSPIAGQEKWYEPPVLELVTGARAVGLGGAYQLGAPDSDALFHNPAALTRGEGMMLGGGRFGPGGSFLSASSARPWWGGSVGIGVRALEYGTLASRRYRPGALDPFFRDGDTGVGELAASLGYARSVGPVVVGAAGVFTGRRVGPVRETTASLDVGATLDLGGFRLGLAGRNLGFDRTVEGHEIGQPLLITLNAGRYGLQAGPLDLGMAASVSRAADGDFLGGAGLEVGYWPIVGRTFVLRVGAEHGGDEDAFPMTFGGSYWGDDLVLEYAFQPVDHTDGMHRLSIGWR